jgi:taurine dioxygenase
MIQVIPTGKVLGARVEGLDLAQPLGERDANSVVQALGQYGVLRFPGQKLSAANLRDFSAQFGDLEVNVISTYQEPGMPEVMILSNMLENDKQIGLRDAGQGWHTDLSYAATIALANVLYAIKIPQRDGKSLGATEFCDMATAYDDLPDDMKRRLQELTALHDFAKFWDMMRARPGSTRGALSEAQRREKPPVSHPLVITHPITGRKLLYANEGYVMRVNELSKHDSDELLGFLFEHQIQDRFRYTFRWQAGDVLMADNLRTIHQAVPDYGPDEHRLLKRCQVMATRFVPH